MYSRRTVLAAATLPFFGGCLTVVPDPLAVTATRLDDPPVTFVSDVTAVHRAYDSVPSSSIQLIIDFEIIGEVYEIVVLDADGTRLRTQSVEPGSHRAMVDLRWQDAFLLGNAHIESNDTVYLVLLDAERTYLDRIPVRIQFETQ